MANTRKEKKKLKAKIIGLWGDPGLTEYHNYDILSRFLIVQVQPFEECVTNMRKSQMIKLVLRPKSLWISVQSGGSSVGTIRRDAFGNLNQQNITGAGSTTPGLFTSSGNGVNQARFLAENIQPISPSYKIGDEITISELDKVISLKEIGAENKIFKSEDTRNNTDAFMSNFYRDLEKSAYVNNNINKNLSKTGTQFFIRYLGAAYFPAYHKILQALNKKFIIGNMASAAAKNATVIDQKIKRHGGIFDGTIEFNSVIYEDLNLEKRKRDQQSACVPLVVVNPSTFPTPAVRNIGGINIGFTGPAGPAGPPGPSS